jgi:SnoaL-like domain
VSGANAVDLALAVVEAVNSRDPDRLAPLLHPRAEVITARGTKAGAAQVIAWAEKAYEHLDRRYAVDVADQAGDRVLLRGHVEYVWREEAIVGDAAPIALVMQFEGNRLRRLRVEDDPDAALVAFES